MAFIVRRLEDVVCARLNNPRACTDAAAGIFPVSFWTDPPTAELFACSDIIDCEQSAYTGRI